MQEGNIIKVRKDSSEVIEYDYSDFMAYIRLGDLSSFNYACNAHWHDDIEMIRILSGKMAYNVNGSIVQLEAGDGIIVNSRQMHYGFSETETECTYVCMVLHPMLLCVSHQTEAELVTPILSDSSLPYILLHSSVPWEREILDCIQEIYDMREKPTAKLRIHGLFDQIWATILENAEQCRKHFASQKRQYKKLNALKKMIDFIHDHYMEKISVEDIAAAGIMSKSSCLVLFKRYLNDTPVNFLINYRLKLGAQLLQNSDMTVTNISYQAGFANVSYFVEAFHKVYGCQPLEYRKKYAGKEKDNG